MFLKLSGIQKCLWLCLKVNVGEKEAFFRLYWNIGFKMRSYKHFFITFKNLIDLVQPIIILRTQL